MKFLNRLVKKLLAIIVAVTLLVSVMPLNVIAAAMQMQSVAVTITGFEELCPDIAHQTVSVGISLEELNLPAELTAFVTVKESQAVGFFSFGLSGIGALHFFSTVPHFEPKYSACSYDATYCICSTYAYKYDYYYENEYDYDYKLKYACEYEYGCDEKEVECAYAYEYCFEYDYDKENEACEEYELCSEYECENEKDEEDGDGKPDSAPWPVPPLLPAVPQTIQVPVAWEVSFVCSSGDLEFDGYTAGMYVFAAKVEGDFVLAHGVEMPKIMVTVEALAIDFAAAQSVATGNFVESGTYLGIPENTVPWSFYDCGTLELGSGTLVYGNFHWPGELTLSTIVFTAPVIATGSMLGLFTSSAFYTNGSLGWSNLEATIEGLQHLDTSGVTDMRLMFAGFSGNASLDLTDWNTASVTNMSHMFRGALVTSLNLSGWNTSQVTNMRSMFERRYSHGDMISLDLSGWDTSRVQDMLLMFSGVRLTSLDLSGWDTSSVSMMGGIFSGSSFFELNLSGWDTSNVTNMSSMFSHTEGLTNLDLSRWDTSSVTNMNEMFHGASSLTSLDLSGWDTSSVTTMNNMFSGASGLTELDLSSFDTRNLQTRFFMFDGANSLTYLTMGPQFYGPLGPNIADGGLRDGYWTNPRVLTTQELSLTPPNERAGTWRYSPVPPVVNSVSITPPLTTVFQRGQQVSFSATAFGTYPPQAVIWSVSGPAAIDANGVVTVNQNAPNGAVITVTATSAFNPVVSATATVTVYVPTDPVDPIDLDDPDDPTDPTDPVAPIAPAGPPAIVPPPLPALTPPNNIYIHNLDIDLVNINVHIPDMQSGDIYVHLLNVESGDIYVHLFDTEPGGIYAHIFDIESIRSSRRRGIFVIDLRHTEASGANLPREFFGWLLSNEYYGLVVRLPDGSLSLNLELLRYIAHQDRDIHVPELDIPDRDDDIPEQAYYIEDQDDDIPEQEYYIEDQDDDIPEQAYYIEDRDDDIPEQAYYIEDQDDDTPEQAYYIEDQDDYILEQVYYIEDQDDYILEQEYYIEDQEEEDRIELIIYLYDEVELPDEYLHILCYGDRVFNVQLLIHGTAITYIPGRLAVTVEYSESPSPGVWRICEYGELILQESVFNPVAGLVTFFPDRLSNFIVGYHAYARTIAIFRADGGNNLLYSRGIETASLRPGMRISTGDRLTTGADSIIFLTMDQSTILKLGENSEAEITQAGRNLEILVTSGNALVRVDAQEPHHTTTIRTQNTAIGVRGTMFTVSVDEEGRETIVMLSGYGEVNGVLLAAGYVFTYGAYEPIAPLDIETVCEFTLLAIVGNFEYLSGHLDIDLTGIYVDALPLPSLYEIRELEIEELRQEYEYECIDDCAPLVEEEDMYLLHERRQFGRRC